MALKQVLYIQYLIEFEKKKIKVLINSSSKLNVMTSTDIVKLSLKIWKTDFEA